MPWFDPAPVVSYPELTWEQAMVLLYHYEAGKGSRTRLVQWKEMCDGVYMKHGFVAYGAASELRDNDSISLLLFEPGKPHIEQHRLPEGCFRDHVRFFEAINAAERRHNARNDEAKIEYAKAVADGKKLDPQNLRYVPITPMPNINETVGVALGDSSMGAQSPPQYTEGSIVQTPSGPCEIIRVGGVLSLRPLPMVQPPASEVAQHPKAVETPKKIVLNGKKPANPAGNKAKKGHRVA